MGAGARGGQGVWARAFVSATGLESRCAASQQQHACECRTPASRLRDARRKADSGDLRQIGGSLKTTLVSYASNMPYPIKHSPLRPPGCH